MLPIEIERLSECTPTVVDELNVLIPQLKPAWDPVTVAGLERVLASPTRVYVARHEGVVVGLTLAVPHRHLAGLRLHLEDVVVRDDLRRHGIARRLISAIIDDAPDDVVSFDLRSHRSHQPTHALYASLGFVASDTTVFRRPAT